jgi:hypothetical protein
VSTKKKENLGDGYLNRRPEKEEVHNPLVTKKILIIKPRK